MPPRRLTRPLLKPVFLACEGFSEQGYGRWLNRLASELKVPAFINTECLEGGDFCHLIEKAVRRLARTERQKGPQHIRGLLLDTDCLGRDPDRDANAFEIAEKKNFHLIRQRPTHEAFLVRHFDGYQDFLPEVEEEIWPILHGLWPEYEKGMDAYGYGATLSLDYLANARGLEPDLDHFLTAFGWHRNFGRRQ